MSAFHEESADRRSCLPEGGRRSNGWLGPEERTRAKGGEALMIETLPNWRPGDEAFSSDAGLSISTDPKWHVLWTRSNCEQQVHDQLAGKGFRVFLPRVEVWCRRGGRRRLERAPLFPGYLFVRHAIDKASYIEIRKARGLVCLLGASWDRPAEVPEREIESVHVLLRAGRPILPHPYLKEGRRVRIVRGPLAGVEGILTRARLERGLLVVSVDLLSRSVAVEIDCTAVA